MPQLDSYLFFDGTCAEAMRFYHRTLGGTLQPMLTYGQSPHPESCPADSAERIMHTALVLDGRLLMASDSPAGQHRPAGGFALSLTYPTADEARRVFASLTEGGSVMMPPGETFWTECFAMGTDRFGTAWMVSGGQAKQVG